jgi:hypothetical protein
MRYLEHLKCTLLIRSFLAQGVPPQPQSGEGRAYDYL